MNADESTPEVVQDTLAARQAAVLAELERILAGPAFRTARRSQELLRYIVVNALEGHFELLKERSIGAGVFQRAPDYDTGEDAIVRVKASELRKRLAQYYLDAGPGPELNIEVPAGSYMPEFRFHEKAVETPVTPAVLPPPKMVRTSDITPLNTRRLLLAVALVLMIGAIGIVVYNRSASGSALDRFWAPVFANERPVLLCVAHPVVFTVRRPTRDAIVQNSPPELVPSGDISRDGDNYIGYGDAYALAQLSGFFNRKQKPVSIRMGNDIAFADVRAQPAVLIGAFTNQWTMQLTSNLRFVFDLVDGQPIVRDQIEKQVWARDPAKPNLDYVILSRIFDSRSGDAVITAAGLAHAGTYMAGEFLTNPTYFEQAVRQLPDDWESRNLQLVLMAEVIGKTPGPPKVVASAYW
ncbi:MAG TPA: hypothetical protein VN428_02450 [Bryobacteraceae bacterium]|nr:hypothetical protein [Bryobacteraceae bacterium]